MLQSRHALKFQEAQGCKSHQYIQPLFRLDFIGQVR